MTIMLYRRLGRASEDFSVLGFGTMRLPVIDGNTAKIDEKMTERMLRYAIENGVNYLDTAYVYHAGMSEPVIGKILSKGLRDKVNIATKLPAWRVNSRKDMDFYLNDQLKRLKTDHIDLYLLHGLERSFWEKMQELGALDFLDSAIKDGRIRYAGFSFHDDVSLFKEIVDAYRWTFSQIQFNYMDEKYQAGTEGLKYAAKKGLGVVVMEPLRGGSLAGNMPQAITEIYDRAKVKRSPAEWGLRFVWDRPEVGVALSGMSTMDQVVENVRIADDAMPGTLSKVEKSLIAKARDAFRARIRVDCTSCGYCMPCPSGVNIPENFRHYNDASIYGDAERIKTIYNIFMDPEQKASKCQDCGECEEKCPQHLPIREKLKDAAKTLGSAR